MNDFRFDHEKMSEKDQERYNREMTAELKRLRTVKMHPDSCECPLCKGEDNAGIPRT